MMQDRILGYAPLDGLDALIDRLGEVPGPRVDVWRGPGLAAFSQAEASRGLFGGLNGAASAGLLAVQRRLEVACQAGPFLPQDPSAALVAADAIAPLLAASWDELADALDRAGREHQWDIVLQWSPETVVARQASALAGAAGRIELAEAIAGVLRAERDRQQARLLAVLTQAVRAFAAGGPTGTDTQVGVTVRIGANTEAAIEAALETLDDPTLTIGLRGPLPPISFAAVRIEVATQAGIEAAWRTLQLSGRVDKACLHRQWRALAAAAHPDRGPLAPARTGADVGELTAAYHRLRGLLPADGHGASFEELARAAVPRLVMPERFDAAPPPARAGVLVS